MNEHLSSQSIRSLISSGPDLCADVVDEQLTVPLSDTVLSVLNFFNHLNQVIYQETIRKFNVLGFDVLFPSVY
jgi:hypothetical protein